MVETTDVLARPERIVRDDGVECWRYRNGRVLPIIAGGEDPPPAPSDPPADPAGGNGDPAPPSPADPPADPEPTLDDLPPEIRRLIHNQREAERRERARAEQAERERDELRRAQESDQERREREAREATARAEGLLTDLRATRLDIAIRDAAAERGVDPRRARRLVQLVQADGQVRWDDNHQPAGVAEAVDAVLEDFPELTRPPGPTADPSSPANSDKNRRNQNTAMSAQDAQRLAKENPKEFNRRFEAGEIPASALGG